MRPTIITLLMFIGLLFLYYFFEGVTVNLKDDLRKQLYI